MRALALTICAALAASGAMAQNIEATDIASHARAALGLVDSARIYRCLDAGRPVYFAFKEDEGETLSPLLGFDPSVEVKRSGRIVTLIESKKVTVISGAEFVVITREGIRSGPCANLSDELLGVLLNIVGTAD